MRIISGIYKGRTFSDKLPDGIRPTTDRARETIFNLLNNYTDFDDIIVADLCSGSGAFGIEALSRGARMVDFVDISRRSCNFIEQTCSSFTIPKQNYRVIDLDVLKYLNHFDSNIQEQYDLIFTDPPYAARLVNNIAAGIVKQNLLKKYGLFIAECSSRDGFSPPKELSKVNERIFGETKVVFFENS